jgi:restriction endonuclease S subunit
MEPRNGIAGADFKGRLFFADPGDVIYSKIDVRNGAIGIIPDELGRVCLSSEYPVYAVNSTVADARYVKLLFRTNVFRRKINSMISGASGRKRVQPSDLESVEVPLPPLPVQRKIVAAWEAARKFAADTATKIARLERDIETRFLADLGLKAPENLASPKAFALRWSEINRWGVEVAWREHLRPNTFKFETKPLGEICQTGTGGTPSRKRPEYFGGGIPWVKTTEVRNNVITATEETLSKEGLANCQAKLYPVGSIVMAMYGQGATRGRTAKLGVEATTNQACLVMTEFMPGLLAEFVWYYLMARYDDIRALASGNNQPNLSAELVRSFSVPIPPQSLQRRMIERITAQRAEIAKLRADATARAEAARADVEAMILGTKAVV